MNSNNRLISIPEVQDLLSLSRGSVYRLIGSGRLPARKIGKSTRIALTDVEALMAGLPPAQIAPPRS